MQGLETRRLQAMGQLDSSTCTASPTVMVHYFGDAHPRLARNRVVQADQGEARVGDCDLAADGALAAAPAANQHEGLKTTSGTSRGRCCFGKIIIGTHS
jgi:hypothetical protein